MHIKTWMCPNGVDLPYIIQVDNPIYKVSIFGDSFAQLAEHAHFGKQIWLGRSDPIFNHEGTWQYFLANLLSAETHSYGVSRAGMGDITNLILSTVDKQYDLYIVFHTDYFRKNIIEPGAYTALSFKKVNNFLSNKKVLNIYWDERHKIKSFGNHEYISNFHLTHRNPEDHYYDPRSKINPLDIGTSYCHMSARGNLLLAIELHKIIASWLKF